MTIVYRENPVKKNCYEIGQTTMDVPNINRTGLEGWCDSRLCETWDERTALMIVKAIQNNINIMA